MATKTARRSAARGQGTVTVEESREGLVPAAEVATTSAIALNGIIHVLE